MSPPAIQGQPKIRHDEQSNSVFLEVSVLGAEATKTKWYLEEKEIATGTGSYRISTQEQEGGKKLLICEIKNYEKSLQGTYKAVFFSPDGKENYATFTVKSGSIQTNNELCHHSGTNFELCKSLDPERLKNAPEFYEKPKITQKDGGKIIQIKIRVKSHIEIKAEWFKNDIPLKTDNRIKLITEKDTNEPEGTILLLEINEPTKEDQAKYKCIVKNGEGRNEQSLNLVFD